MSWPWKPKEISLERVPDVLNMAQLAYRMGKAKEAIKLYQQVLRTDPEQMSALVNLGAMLSQNPKSLPEALSLMEKAGRLEPENKAVLLNLGTIYVQVERLDDAERALDRLNKLDPDYPDLHFNRAHVYLRQGRTREAFLEAQIEIRRNPNNVHAQQLIEGLRSMAEQTESERGSDN